MCKTARVKLRIYISKDHRKGIRHRELGFCCFFDAISEEVKPKIVSQMVVWWWFTMVDSMKNNHLKPTKRIPSTHPPFNVKDLWCWDGSTFCFQPQDLHRHHCSVCVWFNMPNEPRKKKQTALLSMKYWLFKQDPYNMIYYNPQITG